MRLAERSLCYLPVLGWIQKHGLHFQIRQRAVVGQQSCTRQDLKTQSTVLLGCGGSCKLSEQALACFAGFFRGRRHGPHLQCRRPAGNGVGSQGSQGLADLPRAQGRTTNSMRHALACLARFILFWVAESAASRIPLDGYKALDLVRTCQRYSTLGMGRRRLRPRWRRGPERRCRARCRRAVHICVSQEGGNVDPRRGFTGFGIW